MLENSLRRDARPQVEAPVLGDAVRAQLREVREDVVLRGEGQVGRQLRVDGEDDLQRRAAGVVERGADLALARAAVVDVLPDLRRRVRARRAVACAETKSSTRLQYERIRMF